MPRAIVYRRVSTDDQAESGAGLAAQLDACMAWCARNNFEMSGGPDGDGFRDDAVGGATDIDKCPGLVAALAELRKGDVLLVAKRDRLGRDRLKLATLEALVERKKCRVASAAGEGTDGDDASDVLMRQMVDAFSVYERMIIKSRTRAGLAAKKRRGERTGRVPFGKRVEDDGRRSKRGNLPIALVDDPHEQALLERIGMLRAFGFTFNKIVWALNRRGLYCRGKPWQTSSIAYLCGSHSFTKGPIDGDPIADGDDAASAPTGAAEDFGRPAP